MGGRTTAGTGAKKVEIILRCDRRGAGRAEWGRSRDEGARAHPDGGAGRPPP